MKRGQIGEKHHVTRYCKPMSVDDNGLPMASAFKLRYKEEYLSVNWLEFFETSDLPQRIDFVRKAFRDKNYTIKPNGRLAVLRVGEVKDLISRLGLYPVRVEHLPGKNNPSHSGIFGYTASDRLIALEIAGLVRITDMYPTKLSNNL